MDSLHRHPGPRPLLLVRSTAFPAPPITGIAVPVVARVVGCGVLRDLEGQAGAVLSPIASLAAPVVSRSVEVAVRGHLDRDARVPALPESSLAVPAVSEGGE